MYSLDVLLSIISDYNSKDKEIIIKAYEFASRAHAGIYRKSGEPYIVHPLAVAIILAKMHADADSIAAGLLHDCIEDVDGITTELVSEQFNPTVAFLVDGVTKIDKIKFGNNKKLAEDASTKKLIEYMCKDIRILIIKLADRLHNMQTLQFHKPDKQIEISQETRDFFVPFAELIGAYNIKLALEDLSFLYLNHDDYIKMVKLERELMKDNRDMIDEVLCSVSQLLNSKSVPFDVKLSVKNYYGLYKRLMTYHAPEKVHDLFQLKFLLNDIGECYNLRNYVKKIYIPLNDKSKDYIINPKTNMYRALHTSCYIHPEKILQFQMVTPNIDFVNTHGITAHWSQNSGSIENMQHDFRGLQVYQIISELVSSNIEAREFTEDVKSDVLGKKIYVKSPKDEIIELPIGATPVDYAYYIHSYLGDHYKFATVNGRVVEPTYRLKSKDIVEITASNLQTPEEETLLSWVKTSHAKRCIKGIKRRELKRLANQP